MTDVEIRRALIDDLERRIADSMRSAEKERRAAARCADTSPDDAAEYLRFAAHDDRCVAHFQQAIDLLSAAPMPPKDEPR
jgi:hypothetical protein